MIRMMCSCNKHETGKARCDSSRPALAGPFISSRICMCCVLVSTNMAPGTLGTYFAFAASRPYRVLSHFLILRLPCVAFTLPST